jgi:hypothetical protein
MTSLQSSFNAEIPKDLFMWMVSLGACKRNSAWPSPSSFLAVADAKVGHSNNAASPRQRETVVLDEQASTSLRNGSLVATISNTLIQMNEAVYQNNDPGILRNQPAIIKTISHAGKSSRLYNWGHIFPVLAEEHGILVNEDLQSMIVEGDEVLLVSVLDDLYHSTQQVR